MTKPSYQDFGTHDESAYPELWDGVVGAWAPCLGPTGLRLHDLSRRANWGTLTAMDTSAWVIRDGQYALRFNAGDTNDRVIVTNPALSQWSVCAWVRLAANAAGTTARVFSQSGFNLEISLNSQGLRVFDGAWRFVVSTVVATQAWYHMAVTFNGSIMSGAVNSLFGTAVAGRALLTTSAIGNDIGLAAAQDAWLGEIDSVVMYSRAISQLEIGQLYQLGRAGMYQRRRRRAIYLPQAGFQPAWARGSNVMLGFNQP